MIRALPSKHRILFMLLFANFALFGAIVTVVGATLPEIIRTLDWSYWVAGMVLASNSFAYFVTTFVAGWMAHRIGLRRMAVIGLILQAIGIGLFGAHRSLLFNLAAFLTAGIGQGAIEIVTNYTVVQIERRGQSRLMNLMHAAFTIGAITAPFAIGILLGIGIEWRLIFLSLAAASFGMMGALGSRSIQFDEPKPEDTSAASSKSTVFRGPLFLLLAAVLFLYVGAEIGISSWIAEFYVTAFSVPAPTAAYMVSLFWLGIFLGRLLTSMVYKGGRQTRVLAFFALLASLSLTAALCAQSPALSALLFFCTGLGFSTIYPTVMTIAGNHCQLDRGPAIGIVSTGGGVGMCVFPLIMAGIANRTSVRVGFGFYLFLTLVMTGVIGGVWWMLRRSRDGDSSVH